MCVQSKAKQSKAAMALKDWSGRLASSGSMNNYLALPYYVRPTFSVGGVPVSTQIYTCIYAGRSPTLPTEEYGADMYKTKWVSVELAMLVHLSSVGLHLSTSFPFISRSQNELTLLTSIFSQWVQSLMSLVAI